jgi:hypothetical protein
MDEHFDNEYEENMRGLENAWNTFVHDMYNGRNSHLHPPPALVEAVQYCWLALARTDSGEKFSVAEGEEVSPTMPIVVPAGFLNLYGAVMFEYGQRAISFGMLVQNMVQCSCTSIDEADLTQVVSEWSKKEEGK